MRQRSSIIRKLPAVVVAAVVLLVSPVPVAAQDDGGDGRRVVLSRDLVDVGDEVRVRGSGFEPEANVFVEVCGAGGVRGSIDCDLTRGLVTPTDDRGRFRTSITVGRPPAPCPCVVRTRTVAGPAAPITRPIDIVGVPTAAVPEVPPTRFERIELELDARLEGRSFLSWFGGPARRTLVVRLENVSDATLFEGPWLDVRFGRGDTIDRAVESRLVPTLRAGEEVALEIPIDLGAFPVGRYTVEAEVVGQAREATVRTEVFLAPWGLLVAAGIVVLLIAVAALRWLRNRRWVRRLTSDVWQEKRSESAADDAEDASDGDAAADSGVGSGAAEAPRPSSRS